jgi:hypothetical protein
MSLFPIVFLVMLALVAAMAVGVLFGRKPIAGTCGGLNMMGDGGACEICGGDPNRCEEVDEDAVPRGGDPSLAENAAER